MVMAERKEENDFYNSIIAFFKKKSVAGHVMLTIPEVATGLKVDRRKIETPLAMLSMEKTPLSVEKNPPPPLLEIQKGRVKYYMLRDVFDFCQKWARD